eukprot:evm.model.scf_539.6 EVM.evm.TU.scf_539.6   scf_539:36712-52419(+)
MDNEHPQNALSLDGPAEQCSPLSTQPPLETTDTMQGAASESVGQGQEDGRNPKPARRREVEGVPKGAISLSRLVNTLGLGLGAAACWGGWKGGVIRAGGGFVWGVALGCAAGLGITRRYNRNRRSKHLKLQFLGHNLSSRVILDVLKCTDPHNMPSVFSSERVESVNRTLKQIWPFYEPVIGKLIVETVTPLFEVWKPSFIKTINFDKLTFGDVPFSITQLEVLRHGEDEFVLQAAIRWDGTASVSLMVEAGGVKMVPKVDKLDFFANVRIALTPLVPILPCFGAMTLAFMKPPMVNFEISIGTPLMGFNSTTVKDFLTNFVVHHIFGDLLVWPNRIVIPILPEEEIGSIDHLYMHTRGVLRVVVKEADGMGVYGDRTAWKVYLQTVASKSHCTKAKSGDSIVWEEEHHLQVVELCQGLHATVVDRNYRYVDPLMASTTKLETQHGRKVGSCFVDIHDLEAGVPVDSWYELISTAKESGTQRLHLPNLRQAARVCYHGARTSYRTTKMGIKATGKTATRAVDELVKESMAVGAKTVNVLSKASDKLTRKAVSKWHSVAVGHLPQEVVADGRSASGSSASVEGDLELHQEPPRRRRRDRLLSKLGLAKSRSEPSLDTDASMSGDSPAAKAGSNHASKHLLGQKGSDPGDPEAKGGLAPQATEDHSIWHNTSHALHKLGHPLETLHKLGRHKKKSSSSAAADGSALSTEQQTTLVDRVGVLQATPEHSGMGLLPDDPPEARTVSYSGSLGSSGEVPGDVDDHSPGPHQNSSPHSEESSQIGKEHDGPRVEQPKKQNEPSTSEIQLPGDLSDGAEESEGCSVESWSAVDGGHGLREALGDVEVEGSTTATHRLDAAHAIHKASSARSVLTIASDDSWDTVTPRETGPRLRLELTYMPLDWLRRGCLSTTQHSVHHGLLFFRLLRGFNLPAGLHEPYCELRLVNTKTGEERETKISRAMKQVHNFYIEWNESFEWFNVSVDEVMTIQVIDEGKIRVKQVGHSEIPMSDVAAAVDPSHAKVLIETLTLEGSKGGRGGGNGDLEVEMDWVPLDHNPIKGIESGNCGLVGAREVGAGKMRQRGVLRRGCLHVRLLWARDLQNVDWVGKSDPYVVMRVNANQLQSSVVQNDLNPKWCEEFEWRSVKDNDILAIDILDRGTIADRVLGRCDVKISAAATKPGEVQKLKEVLLSADMTKPAGGTIALLMHFHPTSSSGDEADRVSPVWPELTPDDL